MIFRKNIKKLLCILFVLLIFCFSLVQGFAASKLQAKHSADIAFSEDTWWDRGVQYGRILVINNIDNAKDDVLLATHCELNAGLTEHPPRYPIYRSTDGGKNWKIISYVTDTLSGASSEWNPTLFELEKPWGKYPVGTIVLAACSIDPEHKKESHIRLYFSTDGGFKFNQGVTIASAGGLENGVWEPFLVQLDDGSLVCYYSDDSDPKHSQTIVYKQSKDGKSWSDAVTVTASENFKERPGMPVVTRLSDGSYFMVYEVVDKEGIDGNPVYFKKSTDGLNWGNPADIGTELQTKNGKKALGSAPYCGWTPVGGENGTLIVSGASMRKGESKTGTDYFLSYDNGETWKTTPHLIPYTTADHVGYSNSFTFSKDGKTMYAINNPQNPENPEKSKMVIAVAEISELSFIQENQTTILIVLVAAMVVIVLVTSRKEIFKNKKAKSL